VARVGTIVESAISSSTINSSGITIHSKPGDLIKQRCDIIVIGHDSRFSCTGGLARCIAQLDTATARTLRETLHPAPRWPIANPLFTTVASEHIVARGMLHVVVPLATTDNSAQWLSDTFRSCLLAAAVRNCKSICFPALGTGVGSFSYEQCAVAFYTAIRTVLNSPMALGSLKEITIVLTTRAALLEFKKYGAQILVQ
jgi:O-acetyl-ADP-ribose deacetylase (regulator of RNase III)